MDNPVTEGAYVALVIIAWTWALSQLRYAASDGDAWRWITAYWLTSKAVFFTVAASVRWLDTLHEPVFRLALYNLVLAHLVAFIAWLRLPRAGAPAPDP